MQLMGVSIVDGWGHLHNKASCKLGCTWLPREAKKGREREIPSQDQPLVCPSTFLSPFPLPGSSIWSSVGLCVKTAQQKNPRVATVEAGSLKSSPDERLQLTVGQWAGGDCGDSGADRQSDIRDIGLTYQVSAHLRHQGLWICLPHAAL